MAEFPKITEFRYAVFDLDGTLVDSVSYCQKVFAELAANRGIPEKEAYDFYASTTGLPLDIQFKKLLALKGFLYTKAELEDLRAGFNREFIKYNVSFFPDAICLIHALERAGVRLFVSSASSDETVIKRLNDGEILSRFERTCGSTQIDKGPAHIEEFAKHLDVLPVEFAMNAFFCGDGERDMEIASTTGLYPVGIAGTVSAERLYGAGAKRVVDRIGDLLQDLLPNDP